MEKYIIKKEAQKKRGFRRRNLETYMYVHVYTSITTFYTCVYQNRKYLAGGRCTEYIIQYRSLN